MRSGARRGRAARELHEFCLVGWYSMTLNANGDVVACCILQDRRSAVLGNVGRSSLREIWSGPAYRRFRRELAEIMARKGEVSDFGHACAVEGVCAEKGACPDALALLGRRPRLPPAIPRNGRGDGAAAG